MSSFPGTHSVNGVMQLPWQAAIIERSLPRLFDAEPVRRPMCGVADPLAHAGDSNLRRCYALEDNRGSDYHVRQFAQQVDIFFEVETGVQDDAGAILQD